MASSKKQRARAKASKNIPVSSQPPGAVTDGIILKMQTAYAALSRQAARFHLPLEIIAVLLIIALGISCRLEDLGHWKKNKVRTFYNAEPLHTTFDAWFYLSLAQDLVDDTYRPVDERRGIPQSPPRPSPPPLISVLAAQLVKCTSYTMSWVGAILPAVLGPLMVIPLYLMGRFYGGIGCGLIASIVAMLYPFYIHRSNLGRFDTDCMILTFSMGASYVFLRFAILQHFRRYAYFACGMVLFAFFLWWWDQTPAAVCALTGLPLLVALVMYYRPLRKEGMIFYSLLIAGAIIALCATDPTLPVKLFSRLWHEFLYITKDDSQIFPNIGKTISEQSVPSFADIVRYTTDNSLSFLYSLAGFILLMWHKRKDGLFLLAFIIMSVLAVTTANRFLLFMVPIVALGAGYATIFACRRLIPLQPLQLVVCTIIICLLTIPLYIDNTRNTQLPKEPGFIVQAMDIARKTTPENAVIWAWWDHGYALTYYARRATMNDGSIHGGERTVYNAIPYATNSFRLSANFMQFYVIRGMNGIKHLYEAVDNDIDRGLKLIKMVLASGPGAARSIIENADLKPVQAYKTVDDWLIFFYPKEKRPVYLFCDDLLTRISYWWYWFGSWDIAAQDGRHPLFRLYKNIRSDQNYIVGSNGLKIDRAQGLFYDGNRAIKLASISRYSAKSSRMINKYKQEGYQFEFNNRKRYGALMEAAMADTVFSKLFIRQQTDPAYFKAIVNEPPYFQLWEVTGDSL